MDFPTYVPQSDVLKEFIQFYYTPDGKVGGLDFEFVLRPLLLQVGAYPSNYTHTERFVKQSGNR